MKKIIGKIIKGFLIFTVVVLTILLIFGIVLLLKWPWWTGFFVLTGIVGLIFGIIFIRKLLTRRREEMFVQQVIDQDESFIGQLTDKDKERSKELQDRWKEAIDALKSSHLKKFGNPLYVLPWYLLIGESGSGKSTSIQSARLSSPFAEMNRASGISGTRNCDWWFFEQAIIIDTAGRYAIPVDEGRDKDEWQKFLTLLVKFRKREPLNGLVVTIAADKLLDSSSETLQEDGRSIRRRIDELMRVLGAKFPIYVLVTKCDLVKGMTQFCDQLPEKAHDQAMGHVNHHFSTDIPDFLNRVFHNISERLRDLRLMLFHKTQPSAGSQGSQPTDPGLLLFPEEFERMKQGLKAFVMGAFEENVYQETPRLRGVFFSSGRQEGSPYSHFLKQLGLIEQREVLPGTNKGLFLFDFFSKILPRDRQLFAPTQKTIEWSRLTRNMGLTSWVAVMIALCGFLSFSFVKNLKTLREVANQFTKPPILQGRLLQDMIIMDRFKVAILKAEQENRNWWIPHFFLYESDHVENELKAKYCKQFKEAFLLMFDKQMADRMTKFDKTTPDAVIGHHVAHLVARINLINAKLNGQDLAELKAKPQPSYEPLITQEGQDLIPEVDERFQDLYLYNLVWNKDSTKLNQELNELQTWLKHIVTEQRTDLNWLAAWTNTNQSLNSPKLADFWGGSEDISATAQLTDKEVLSVPPAYTTAGKQQIDTFITQLESALTDPLVIAASKQEFQKWYHDQYLTAWQKFATAFPKGRMRLKGKEEWQQVAAMIAGDKGPYFSLLDDMTQELSPFADQENLPTWVKRVFEFAKIKDQASQLTSMEKTKGILKTATSKGRQLIDRLEFKASGAGGVEGQMKAAKAYIDYEKALTKITPISSSRRIAYDMTSQVFKEDAALSKSPFYQAKTSTVTLSTSMAMLPANEKMFWALITGPYDFLWEYSCNETACYLNEQWEKDVLVEVEGISDRHEINQLLLGDANGYANKFVSGLGAPFISRSIKKGYYATDALDRKIPFKENFFRYLTKGAIAVKPRPEDQIQSEYSVVIKGMPTDANRDAEIRPHATRLELQCENEVQQVVNLQYPIRKTFTWVPKKCDDVNFSIEIGNLVLTKKYTGEKAFPEFLKDFSSGRRRFYPQDFPSEANSLRRMGIKYIQVNYVFRGNDAVIKTLTAGRSIGVPDLPKDIVTCWDH